MKLTFVGLPQLLIQLPKTRDASVVHQTTENNTLTDGNEHGRRAPRRAPVLTTEISE